jgi:hypothetical protein
VIPEQKQNLHENLDRILEMRAGGAGPRVQAATFQEYGINVTAEDLDGVNRSMEELSNKALPKQAVKVALHAVGVMRKYDQLERVMEPTVQLAIQQRSTTSDADDET